MAIGVAIAEDQRLVREALAALLAREQDMEMLGQAATGHEAVDLSLSVRPDVLVLDISLPGMDGVAVARTLRGKLPSLKVLALSVHAEAHFVREMMKAGAAGYLVKGAALAELMHAIRVVAANGRYLSAELEPHEGAAAASRALSAREREVLALLAGGRRSGEIAQALGISAGTVEAHRRNIMRKLDLHSVADLTRYAVREGIVQP
jgi:two-component system NarL family response regulator